MRNYNLKIEEKLSPRFEFELIPSDTYLSIQLPWAVLKPEDLYITLYFDDDKQDTVLTFGKHFIIYRPGHEAGAKFVQPDELELKFLVKRKATLTIIRPWFGRLDKEIEWIDNINYRVEVDSRGIDKTWTKKESKFQKFKDWLDGTVFNGWCIDFMIVLIVFNLALFFTKFDPYTSTTIVSIVPLILMLIRMKR